ncbi:PAS domain-containing protein [Salinisphaera sp. USBA-960]|nr:PAS domain-containing protein [Salifodinibacter halophilus]NNC26547.1 PAS domain-containing protein [Salifodinibacter halophilus]
MSDTTVPNQTTASRANDWRSLQTVNAYRLLITAGLVASLILGTNEILLGADISPNFEWGAIAYGIAALIAIIAGRLRFSSVESQIVATVLMDIVALGCLAGLSQGVRSGFELLLLLPIATAGLLLSGRLAGVLAAIAVLGVVIQEAMRPLLIQNADPAFFEAGLTGANYLIVAGLAHWLALRINASETMARFSAGRARRFRDLNHQIMEQMATGAIVVDAVYAIRLINRSGCHLLGLSRQTCEGKTLADVVPDLARALDSWQAGRATPERLVGSDGDPIFASFTFMNENPNADLLITLENGRCQRERVQHLKLASLGRLTASVSHEVRNPLSAISQATDLLRESPGRPAEDTRLISIIGRHVARIDDITGRMLGLARHSTETQQPIELRSWLTTHAAEHEQTHANSPELDCSGVADNTVVDFDPSQLAQIVTCLWNNAAHHARLPDRNLVVSMTTGYDHEQRPWLAVTDNGPGIEADSLAEILEPFFTTAGDGTGLGLHIARELADSNGARLAAIESDKGATFQLTFNIISSASTRR